MAKNYLHEFEAPSSEFRGAPFWAWNCTLDKETLLKQVDYFREMGLGGFTIHCRTGLGTEYMGEEFMDIVKAVVEKAKSLNMKAYLYDEDRWPSGFGGGIVTKNTEYRARYLVFTPVRSEDRDNSGRDFDAGSSSKGFAKGDGTLLARYDVTLKDGYLAGYRMLEDGEEGENIWYAYQEINSPTPWFNNQTYVDTMNKEAVQCFIDSTHEKYYQLLGEEFGKTVPSIFTDEPQVVRKSSFGRADSGEDVILSYTDGFEESYQAAYGESFLAHIPEVLWELPDGKVSVTRYRYHDHASELFARAYADTLGDWCKGHGIALTGHMMQEPTLQSQTCSIGEAMRHYRGFEVPGIDMLCDRREYTTAKQAQSAVHQMGGNDMTSELYGVTNWDFDFRGHKLQGDWQAALGVTRRVHHLSWVSMAGEAKRDYPASIFYQSPWYKKYNRVEDYFARVNTALKSGNPDVKVGVIHPVESYWLNYGPEEQTGVMRRKLEEQFAQVTEWLLFGLVDFDYISEALMTSLESMEEQGTDQFCVGCMGYDVVILPGCETLRSTTLKRLDAFVKRGGKVIVMGDAPAFVDAVPDEGPAQLALQASCISFEYGELMGALEENRTVEILNPRGMRSSRYLYQMREEGDNKILFIANGKRERDLDAPVPETCTVSVKGVYKVTVLDAVTGERLPWPSVQKDGRTTLSYNMYDHDSLLLYLEKSDMENPEENISVKVPRYLPARNINQVDSYRMSEPNVLMLDQAEFSVDGGEFEPSDEVLRIDNILRKRFGYPLKMESLAQPWVEEFKEEDCHSLILRYRFQSEIELEEVRLAMEDMEECKVILNGGGDMRQLEPDGYFTDESIKTAVLKGIRKGENILLVSRTFSRKTNLEWSYLLGDFGVRIWGSKACLVPMAERIGFGDLAAQTFPFYAGNMTYCCTVETEAGEYELEVNKYRAPLLSVAVDGREAGEIMFAPYRVSLGHLEAGRHEIAITAYGSRVNAFGTVHNCDEEESWYGPNAWRSVDQKYSYEYQLKRIGVLAGPRLLCVTKG